MDNDTRTDLPHPRPLHRCARPPLGSKHATDQLALHFDALHKGEAFHVRVEAADVLRVEQSNGPGEVAPVVGAGHVVETDGSNTLAGGAVAPFKFEAHLVLPPGYRSPHPSLLNPLLVGDAPTCRDLMLSAFQSEVASTDHNRELALKIVVVVRIAGPGPRLEHQIAKIERAAREIKGHDVIELVC
jgi:hypothetical protein